MKPKTMILMVVAVACGLGASYMTSRLLAERGKQTTEETVMILVAKQKVGAWEPIKDPEKLFEHKPFLANSAPKKGITDFAKLKDQRLNKAVIEGAAVSEEDLLSGEELGLVGKLKPGQRAVSVKVNAESSTAGFVVPGYRVDVMYTTRGNDPHAKIVLQNMLVLAVDAQLQRNPDQPHIVGQTVTLAASGEEAQRLSLAASQGELRLLPKTPGDDTPVRTRRVSLSDLDKDSTPREKGDRSEETGEGRRPGGLNVPKFGSLPPVEEAPKVVEAPKAEPKVEAPRPRPKRFVMTITQGSKTEKHVFIKGLEDDDDEPSSSGNTETTTPAPTAPPAPTPAPKKAETPAPKLPPSPFGGRRVPSRGGN